MTTIAVIGGGVAGYTSAIRAAQLGAKVILMEKEAVGGVCVHRGCIPTKTFLNAARIWESLKKSEKYGIQTNHLRFLPENLLNCTGEVMEKISQGIQFIFKSYDIQLLSGDAILREDGDIALNGKHIKADKIIIATGANPIVLDDMNYAHPCVWDTFQALKLSRIPKRMVIVGAGIIGLELAVFYRSFGVDVTILEAREQILPDYLDRSAAVEMQKLFEKKGIGFVLNGEMDEIHYESNQIRLMVDEKRYVTDQMVICIGFKPNTNNIRMPLKKSDIGGICVDHSMETSIKDVYAIGDVAGPPYLAHKAMAEGIVAAESALGMKAAVNYQLIPNCIYTIPEIATVGDTQPINGMCERVRFPFSACGRALTSDETDGFLQLIYKKETKQIVGAVIIGTNASELIHTIMLAIHTKMTSKEIGDLIFAHPTFSEVIKETSRMVQKSAIHFVQQDHP